MRIAWIGTEFVVMDQVAACLAQMGHEIQRAPDATTDAICAMSITKLPEIQAAHASFPSVPLFNYCWDLYSWVWLRPRPGEYDYAAYGRILHASREIWVPSQCTAMALKYWYGPKLPPRRRIRTAISIWEPDEEPRNEGYILNPIREQPDHLWGWLERICKDRGLRLVSPEHKYSFERYRRAVANCALIVSPLSELSTGGLTLLEGLRIGKPCLWLDSPWNGASDYVRPYMGAGANVATLEEFEERLVVLVQNPPVVEPTIRGLIDEQHSPMAMANRIISAIEEAL